MLIVLSRIIFSFQREEFSRPVVFFGLFSRILKMASDEQDQEPWQDVSESSSFSEEDERDQPSILEELELGHVRRIDQENEPSQANQNQSATSSTGIFY